LYGGKANTWILSRDVIEYITNVPDEMTLFYLGGQEAVDRVHGRPQNGKAAGNTMGNLRSLQPPRMVRQSPVYFAKSYYVDMMGKQELLSRVVETGVYNTMFENCDDYFHYRTSSRNIMQYNNDRDAWHIQKIVAVLKGCAHFDSKDPEGKLRPIGNNKAKLSNPYAHIDDADDFLSFHDHASKTRKELEYISDMSVNHLSEKNLIDAGKTLLSSIYNHDEKTYQDAIKKLDKIMRLGHSKINYKTTVIDASTNETVEDFFEDLAQRIVNVVGEDNLFFADVDADKRGKTLYDAFVKNGLVKIKKGAKKADQRILGSADSAAKFQRAIETQIIQVLGSAIPEREADVRTIGTDHSRNWKDRAQQVKNMVIEKMQRNPEDMDDTLRTAGGVDQWFTENMTTFEKDVLSKMTPDVQQQQQVSASVGGGAAEEVQYIPAGSKPPQGWEFENPADARAVTTNGIDLFQMPQFRPPEPVSAGAGPELIGAHARGRAMLPPGRRGAFDQEAADARDKDARSGKVTDGKVHKKSLKNVNPNARTHAYNVSVSAAPRLVKWLAIIYSLSKFTRQRFVAFAEADVYVPLGFLLFRPHATYKTRFGIKVGANGMAGWTMFGHGNMQLAHDVARKMGMLHYTAYLSSIVTQPKHVYVVEDLFCQKYLGGMGVDFWTPEEYRACVRRTQHSILTTVVPPNFTRDQLEPKLDIRGRWITEMTMNMVTKERYDRPLFPGSNRFCALWGVHDMNRKDRGSNRGKIAPNFVCWQGVEFYYNWQGKHWHDYTPEQGNFGPYVYPGCGKVRNGEMKVLKQPNYLGNAN
jgi:hypothetical protein